MFTVRQGALAFAAAGLLFLAYPVLRPYSGGPEDGAAEFASGLWVVAHLSAVLGFILLPLGLMALRAGRGTFLAMWFGVGLTLPYYGAEVFGLNAIGLRSVQDHNPALVDLAQVIRYTPTAVTSFGLGLLLIGLGAVLTAVHVWRSESPRWSGVPFALGFALFIPQFFTTPPIRMAHGLLVAVGCVLLAVVLWRRDLPGRQDA